MNKSSRKLQSLQSIVHMTVSLAKTFMRVWFTNVIIDDYWEKRTFTEMENPEYKPGATGRIHWTIDHYNGTKDKPNKELVMYSDKVNVGGYDWHIKFYPRGNDSDYLSVYVECASLLSKDPKKDSST